MKLRDKLLAAIPDATIEDAVRAGANSVGVKLGDDAVTVIVAAVRQALREMIDEAEAEAARNHEMRSTIQREVQRFMRAIGARPNGRYQTL